MGSQDVSEADGQKDTSKKKTKEPKSGGWAPKKNLGQSVCMLKATKNCQQGEIFKIEGETDSCWKVASQDKTRHMAIRKDNEGETWCWPKHFSIGYPPIGRPQKAMTMFQ